MKILLTSDWYIPAVNGVVTSVKNLQYLRQLSGNMTQESLADKLNVRRQTISKFVTND